MSNEIKKPESMVGASSTSVVAKTSSEAPAPAPTEVPTAAQITNLLLKMAKLEAKVEAKEVAPVPQQALKSTEIDWSKVNEDSVADLDFPIPVIEHEMPDYMTIHLKDNNYVAKWIHQLPSHLGTMLASGYEWITESDWDPNFPKVLGFNSEGHLTYEDVVGLKVHKSRYLGKLRRDFLKSTQIRGVAGMNKVKGLINNQIQNDPRLESAINRGAMSFYGEEATSGIEVHLGN